MHNPTPVRGPVRAVRGGGGSDSGCSAHPAHKILQPFFMRQNRTDPNYTSPRDRRACHKPAGGFGGVGVGGQGGRGLWGRVWLVRGACPGAAARPLRAGLRAKPLGRAVGDVATRVRAKAPETVRTVAVLQRGQLGVMHGASPRAHEGECVLDSQGRRHQTGGEAQVARIVAASTAWAGNLISHSRP